MNDIKQELKSTKEEQCYCTETNMCGVCETRAIKMADEAVY